MHQIPPQPNYLRVKIWRRLQRIGAVTVKNSVYALPLGDQGQEDFQWVMQEIREGGGDAFICEARFVSGLTDVELEALFNAERDKDYLQIADDAREALVEVTRKKDRAASLKSEVAKLRKRLSETAAIDFFGAPARTAAEKALVEMDARLVSPESEADAEKAARPLDLTHLSGRTWVTRKGIHVDRIASAWLIRRFIDVDAKFKFVPGKGYRPEPGEIRFDMFEAEYTHEGDRCSFEVLLDASRLQDRALRAIAEIVHDIDLKDGKFGREETPGIAGLILGIARAHAEDEKRLARGAALFDDLHSYFQRKRA
jgi:hypothetical protein